MEFVNSTFCESLSKDPSGTLRNLALTVAEKKEKLWPFVKYTAETYKIGLSCSPTARWDIAKWKDVAKMMSSSVSIPDPLECSECGDPAYVSKLIYAAHFRSAYIATRRGREYLVLGCLVNEEKYDPSELPGWKKLLNEYNDRVSKIYGKNRKVIHIREWLNK